MGIFRIGFRRYKYWKVLNKIGIPYFGGVLPIVCSLLLLIEAILANFRFLGFLLLRERQGVTVQVGGPLPRSEKSQLKMIGRPQIPAQIFLSFISIK